MFQRFSTAICMDALCMYVCIYGLVIKSIQIVWARVEGSLKRQLGMLCRSGAEVKICAARVIGVNGRNLCWKRPQPGRPVMH